MKADVTSSGSPGRMVTSLAVLGLWLHLAAGDHNSSTPWPRSLDTPQGRCTVFQPRPAVLDGDRLNARAALAVVPPDSTNTVFGIAELQARVTRSADGKQASVSDIALTSADFAPANAPKMAGLADTLRPELGRMNWTLPWEEVQAGLDGVARERSAARGLNTTPPRILYRSEPAVLVVLDGPPELRALTNTPVLRAVNTPYAMLFDPAAQRYWLRGSQEWYSATDWRGDWTPAAEAPPEIAAAIPPDAAKALPANRGPGPVSPRVVVATEPSELLVTRGEPAYTPVAGSDLLYVSNSEQLLFFTIDTKEYYVALSGRWYRSPSLTGPWDSVASEKLPPAFARILPGSPRSEALTYVAGTVEARDAVAQANIPQITTVERGPADVDVRYEGAPQFQSVADAGVQYATNTVDAVFLVRGTYYLCRDAVWYSGPGADGPWEVATSVPAEIQSLPPTNPHYHVKYVYVYGVTPEEVYVGYLPGYAGCYVYGPTVVYGTGWWYPGYYGPAYCWAYPATFGFGFGYNSWCGWSVGIGFSYGWLGCGYGWAWGDCYPWGWWGPCGAYWACAPRYPCYDGHHYDHDGHGEHGDHGGAQSAPPRGGSRYEVRKDVPGPTDRPSNPQRRTLPSYARSAKSPTAPATALQPTRSVGAGANQSGPPNRLTQFNRGEVASGQNASPQRTAPPAGSAPRSGDRAGTPAPPAAAGSPQSRSAGSPPPRAADARSVAAPPSAAAGLRQSPAANQPQRQPPSGAAATGQALRAPPGTYSAPPTSAGAGTRPTGNGFAGAPPPAWRGSAGVPAVTSPPSRSWSGATPGSYSARPGSGIGRAPVVSAPATAQAPWRSTAPSFGTLGRAPAMNAPMGGGAAPAMRSSGSPSFSAPMRSAPMGSPGGFSGGSFRAPSRGH